MTLRAFETELIDSPESMAALAPRLKGIATIAVDTEFVREKTFTPRLELIQLGLPDGTIEIVDWSALGPDGAGPLIRLLQDSSVLKVFHAAGQDLEILAEQIGGLPGPIWDTQLVAGLFGYTGRLGYAAVVEALLGQRPIGGEALTDWSRRPLAEEQLRYAAEDVHYLLPLFEEERGRLEALNRLTWAEEECEELRTRAGVLLVRRTDTEEPHHRVKGWQKLRPRQLAILRELARWRQQEAERSNRPIGRVVRDDLLIEITRRCPKSPGDLEILRGLPGGLLSRHGQQIIAAVAAGVAVPKDEYPEAAERKEEPDDTEKALVSLLQAALRTLAVDRQVAVTLLGSTADVSRLVASHLQGESLDAHRLLQGWRGELVGGDLRAVLEGDLSIGWDPDSRMLRLTPHS